MKSAFSLIELIVVLAIISVLILFGVSNLTYLFMRQERSKLITDLKQAIALAQAKAFQTNVQVTLCGLGAGAHCSQDWSKGFMVFVKGEDAIKPLEVLKTYPKLQYGTLSFKAFGAGGSPFILTFEPNGMTFNNGTFIYCPFKYGAKEADGLIINKGGRAHQPSTRNQEGLLLKKDDGDKEVPLQCS